MQFDICDGDHPPDSGTGSSTPWVADRLNVDDPTVTESGFGRPALSRPSVMRRHAGKAGHSRQQLLPITACCLRNCEEGNDGGAQVSDRARWSAQAEVAVELAEVSAPQGQEPRERQSRERRG